MARDVQEDMKGRLTLLPPSPAVERRWVFLEAHDFHGGGRDRILIALTALRKFENDQR